MPSHPPRSRALPTEPECPGRAPRGHTSSSACLSPPSHAPYSSLVAVTCDCKSDITSQASRTAQSPFVHKDGLITRGQSQACHHELTCNGIHRPKGATSLTRRIFLVSALLSFFILARHIYIMRWGLPLAVVAPLLSHVGHGYEVKTGPLDTDWTYNLGTDPWPEYPRPQLRRDDWLSLNGVWKWRAASGLSEASTPPVDEDLIDEVLIPSCLESAISGVMMQDITYAWFTTNFEVPEDWSSTAGRVLLNFEAVDYEATVFINGQEAGFHRGGYWRFTLDITDLLKAGANSIHVFVFDPTDMGDYVIPVGKQTRNPSHIFYTPCTGIWQTVWLESVPASHITQIDVSAGMDGEVTAKVWSSANSSQAVAIQVIDNDGKVVATHDASSDEQFTFTVDSPKLWSPDSPTLYNLTFTMGSDEVHSYTGFRTISIGEVEGIPRPLINGEFIFTFGPLDQGWWPDGLMLPPNREAMEFDLKFLKSQGINMLRKHIKVEPDLYYRACDELGILVIQDMVSLRTVTPNAEQQTEWERQIDILISQHKSYPSIWTWVIYNEGWGQITSYYPEFDITAHIKSLDPTRLIIATSGWIDHGAGDWHDNHHYANPQCGTPFYSIASTPYDNKRIAIQGEFGGIGHNISEEHAWKVQKSIDAVNQTYELSSDINAYNYRLHTLMRELKEQIEMYSCSSAVYTQTTDVEGEVNGFMTYDRRLVRVDDKFKDDVQAFYDAAVSRGGSAGKKIATRSGVHRQI